MGANPAGVGAVAAGPRWEPHDVPFRHWVADLKGVVHGPLVAGEAEWHRRSRPDSWVRYDNDCERRKWACNAVGEIGPQAARLFRLLAAPPFVADLSRLTGVADLRPDPTLHGAGVHVVEPGGWLGPHLDYALSPKLPGMERRVNLILFLSTAWPGDGGAFELYDDAGIGVVARVQPDAGRAVVWCPGDVEFHGTQRVADAAPPRLAAAVYYLAPARPGVTRKRALFVPHRG